MHLYITLLTLSCDHFDDGSDIAQLIDTTSNKFDVTVDSKNKEKLVCFDSFSHGCKTFCGLVSCEWPHNWPSRLYNVGAHVSIYQLPIWDKPSKQTKDF